MGISPAPKWGKVEVGNKGKMVSVAHAHHDFPYKFKKWFAEHGLDVNDPAFGRWVPKEIHERWHAGGPAVGTFNKFWQDFIDAEDDLNPWTVGDILDRLAECRQEFPVNLGYVN